MKRRNLILLGGAAAATTGAVILLTPDRTEPPPNSASPLAFPGLAPRLANAARIEVVRHDGTLVLRRAASGAWVLPDRADHPARPERVREVLVGLTELRLIEPRTANPEMLERLYAYNRTDVMAEMDIDMSNHKPKTFDNLADDSFDMVISLSPHAQHKAVDLTRYMHCEVKFWNIFDPSLVEGSRATKLAAYRQVRDQLRQKILDLFPFADDPRF
jgi:hypothetical protein